MATNTDGLLGRPEFWATHYLLMLADDDQEDADALKAIFGLGHAQVEAFYFGSLVHPDGDGTQPIDLPLFSGFSLQVDYADCGDDGHEVRFAIHHATWREPELLGYHSGHWALPAFRWCESELLARATMRATDDVGAAATVLLMTFPAVWVTDGDDVQVVSNRLGSAWRALPSVQVRDTDALVRNAVRHQRCQCQMNWRLDRTLGWINDGDYSLRNPRTLMRPFSRLRFQRVADLLAAAQAACG